MMLVNDVIHLDLGFRAGFNLNWDVYQPRVTVLSDLSGPANRGFGDEKVITGSTIANAEQVWVLDVNGRLAARLTPDEAGTWSALLSPGDYFIAAVAPISGCQPLIHGPITVS